MSWERTCSSVYTVDLGETKSPRGAEEHRRFCSARGDRPLPSCHSEGCPSTPAPGAELPRQGSGASGAPCGQHRAPSGDLEGQSGGYLGAGGVPRDVSQPELGGLQCFRGSGPRERKAGTPGRGAGRSGRGRSGLGAAGPEPRGRAQGVLAAGAAPRRGAPARRRRPSPAGGARGPRRVATQ